MVGRTGPAAAAAIAVLFVANTFSAVQAWTQERSADLLRPRVALVEPDPAVGPESVLVANAFYAVLAVEVEAVFYTVSPGPEAAVRERALGLLCSVVVRVEPGAEEELVITADRVRIDDPSRWDRFSATVSVEVDRSGRYQRVGAWTEAVAVVAEAIEGSSPAREVTIRAPFELSIEGLPGYASVNVERGEEAVVHRFSLLQLSDHLLTLSAPGYREQQVRIYVERLPATVDVDLRKEARHTVALFARGLSWPAMEYQYHTPGQRWVVGATVTTFAVGFTPFKDDDVGEDPTIVTGYPLTTAHAYGGYLWRPPSARLRALTLVGALVRVVWTDGEIGIDPVVPAGLRASGGVEVEWRKRLIASASLFSDVLFPLDQRFVYPQRWVVPVGPVWIQLPVVRAGVRVVL